MIKGDLESGRGLSKNYSIQKNEGYQKKIFEHGGLFYEINIPENLI